jgi:hypothetical protein
VGEVEIGVSLSAGRTVHILDLAEAVMSGYTSGFERS